MGGQQRVYKQRIRSTQTLKKVFRAGDTIYIRKTEGKLEFLKKEEKARTERTAPADTKTEPETGRERAAHGKASEE